VKVRPLLLGMVWGAGAIACGPSYQALYEGDARFEHCYAIDDTPTVPMEQKSDCWTQWMKDYTYGQTRNRVDYAAMRAKALLDVPAIPTDEALMSAAPGGGTGRVVGHDVPATTNAFAPPPTTMSEADAGQQAPSTPLPPPEATPPLEVVHPGLPAQHALAPPPAPTPRAPCTDRCLAKWQTCKGTCKTGACDCDTPYGGCMKRCF